jgi:hypothetical protein
MEALAKETMVSSETNDEQRRPYSAPRLTIHGNAKTLTANLEAGATDGKGGSHLDA